MVLPPHGMIVLRCGVDTRECGCQMVFALRDVVGVRRLVDYRWGLWGGSGVTAVVVSAILVGKP